jgi:hypothetical protein
MMMSVFTQRQPTRQLEHLALMRLATGAQSKEMVLFAQAQVQACLVVIEGQSAVVKPMAPDDNRLSFESLYDHCITPRDYQRMSEAQVSDLEMLPPSLFEAAMVIEGYFRRVVTIRLKAKDQIAAQNRFRELREDDVFQKKFCKEVADYMWSAGDHWFDMDAHDDLLQVDLVAPVDMPEWTIVSIADSAPETTQDEP